jgi:hypothetical protein
VSNGAGTIEQLVGELAQVFEPLARRLESGSVDSLLPWLGLRQPGVVTTATDLANALDTCATAAANLAPLIGDLAAAIRNEDDIALAAASTALLQHLGTLVQAARGVATGLEALSTGPDLTPAQRAELSAFAAVFVERLLNRLWVEFLETAYPQFTLALLLTGAIEIEEVESGPPDSLNGAYTRKVFHVDRAAKLFTDPAGLLREVYGWGDPAFDGMALFKQLQMVLDRKFEIPAELLQPPGEPALLEAFGFNAEVNDTVSPPGLDVSLRVPSELDNSDTIEAGDWKVTFEGHTSYSADLTATIRPLFELELHMGAGAVDATLGATFERSRTADPFLILGQAGKSRLEIRSPTASAAIDLHFDPATNRVALDPELKARLHGGRLVLDGQGGDSFISTLLAGLNLHSDFDVDLSWSPSRGIRFTGSAALEIAIPAHVSLGPIEIISLYLRASLAEDGSIPVELSCGFKAAFGPLTASVDRLGVVTQFALPKSGGNIGPVTVAFAFKPPSGVGLAVDGGVVKGGGYLYRDSESGEYAGLLELTVSDWLALKAVGLISTRLPGGHPGFALLIIITAEFNPGFQLGFGFTLSGVGGLVGLNRTVLLQPLLHGVRTGAVNNLLFPTDIVENAPKILSDLRVIFPPEQGTFLIGPMAKIGWGTPTLVTISLGVIIEIPGDVVVLGKLAAVLPTADEPLIVLQASFVGTLEFAKRRLWFFAALFESRLLSITLEGEMGLLAHLGDDPNLVLTVGGFHPRFPAPALPFPSPARIAFNLIDKSWARLRVEGYFAITPNTVQLGARADAFFGFDAFGIKGDFSVDGLIRPWALYYIVDISARFSVKVFGVGVWSVRLKGTLEGVLPWRLRGSAEISLLFFSFDVDVDVTFGDVLSLVLAPIEVLAKIVAEFAKPESWRATLPPSGRLFVSLRNLDSPGVLAMHPVGTLQISQRFAPLNQPLDRVGNQKPSDVSRVTASVQAGGLSVLGPTREKFAAAQYRDMDDAAKLSAPAFEPLDSGVELGGAGEPWATGRLAQRNVRYETIIVDTAFEAVRRRFVKSWDALFVHFRAGSATARAAPSLANERRLQPFAVKVSVSEASYTVAWQADNTPYTAGATFGSYAEALAHLEESVRRNGTLADAIHVIPGTEVNRAA